MSNSPTNKNMHELSAQLEAAHRLSQELMSAKSLKEIYLIIPANIIRMFPEVTSCALYIFNTELRTLELVEYDAHDPMHREDLSYDIGDGIVGEAAQSTQTKEINISSLLPAEDGTDRSIYQLATPLLAHGRVIGVLKITHKNTELTRASQSHLLKIVTTQIALAISNSMIYQHNKHTYDEILAVIRTSKQITSIADFNDLVQEILKSAQQITNCQITSLWYKDFMSNQWHHEYFPSPKSSDIILPDFPQGEGIIGHVFKTGKPYYCPETQTDEHYFNTWGTSRSEFALPLQVDNELKGILNIESNYSNAFSDRQMHLLTIIAEEAAKAIANSQLYQIAEQRTRQFIIIREIVEALSHQKSLHDIFKIIAQECLNIIGKGRKSCIIMLVDNAKQTLEVKIALGELTKSSHSRINYPVTKRSIATKVFESAKAVIVPDVKKDSNYVKVSHETASEICYPLLFRDEVVGIINIESDELNGFDQKDLELLRILADNTALSVKIGELYDIRIKHLEAINRISNKINSNLNLDDILQSLAEKGLSAIGKNNRTLFVQLIDNGDNGLKVRALAGDDSFPYQNVLFNTNTGITGHVLNTRSSYLCSNVKHDPYYEKLNPCIRSKLCVPIFCNDNIIGLINVVSSRYSDFGEHEVSFMESLANQAGITIDNAQLNERIANTHLQLTEEMELAVLGETLRHFSHDLRSLITLISGEAQWIERMYDRRKLSLPKSVEAMVKIKNYVQRIEELTHELVVRSHKSPPQFDKVKISDVFKELLPLFSSRAKRHNIIVDIDYDSLDIAVELDTGRIKRAIMNFIMNAIDAMPKGGSLQINGSMNEHYAHISITDTGKGIPENQLKSIWEPFVSTKKRGTGLGLAICRSIIHMNHNGHVHITSKENEGTTVHIKLLVTQPAKSKIKR